MRTLSFVENIEFEYHGNIFDKAMISGDVDNDTGNELVIGNKLGEVVIFKGSSPKPWRKCSDLGMITCVEIGNVCNHGMNYLVTLSAEGWCHVISVLPDLPAQKEGESQDPEVKPVHKQQLFANNKAVLIADVDGDGENEMVVAYTDRRVRCFRWQANALPDLAHSLSPSSANRNAPQQLNGKFVTLETWHLAGQVGSVTMNRKKDGSIDLIASQPGGTYVTLLLPGQGQNKIERCQCEGSSEPPAASQPIESQSEEKLYDADAKQIYHPLGSTRSRNPGISTQVVANIKRRKASEDGDLSNYSAICTLDGTITLIGVDSNILWSLYVDHQLFTLAKLDVTNDGREEVVACSWDGHTYFINLNKDAVRFQFGENVAAFCAGYYAVEGKRNVPCLIYATFNNQIRMYYNIRIPNIGMTSLLDTMRLEPETQQLLSYFNCDANDSNQVRQLYHWCLYGYQPKPS